MDLDTLYKNRELIREIAKNCRNEKYENIQLVCPDGVLALNKLIVFLILPELSGVGTQTDALILLPEVSIQDVHNRIRIFFESVNLEMEQKIQVAETSRMVYLQSLSVSAVERVIDEEVFKDEIFLEDGIPTYSAPGSSGYAGPSRYTSTSMHSEHVVYSEQDLSSKYAGPSNHAGPAEQADLSDYGVCQIQEILPSSGHNQSASLPDTDPSTSKLEHHKNKCDICGNTFKNNYTLKRHKESKHEMKQKPCKHCGKLFTKENLTQHMKLHSEKRLTCDVCERGYTRMIDLNNHKKTHGEARNFQCDVCKKGFHTSGLLKKHLKIHLERKFGCDECGRCFVSAFKLKRHMEAHDGLKHYQCNYCDTLFSRIDNLKKHLRKTHEVSLPDLRTAKFQERL